MNKDFMMGAELALKGAGIQDDRIKQNLMSKLTNAQIAKLTQDLDRNTGFQNMANEFIKPRQIDVSGASGYVPEGATLQGMTPQPSFDSPEFMQKAMQFLEPQQAVTAMIAQGTRETPQQKFLRDAMIAQIRAGASGEAKTAMSAYLQKNPNATAEQIAAYQRSLSPTMGGEGKPVNMPQWYDDLGVSTLGSKYHTPEGQRKFADFIQTPAGQLLKEKSQKKYVELNTPPIYTFPQTNQGIVPGNVRTGEMGPPSGYGKPMAEGTIVAQQQIGTLSEIMDKVRKTYNPNYVGPVYGRAGQLESEWINIPKDQASFYAYNAQINNTLVYLLSGKQINEEEYKRLKKQMPSPELPNNTYEARMENFTTTLDSIIAERAKNMGAYNPANPKPTAPTGGSTIRYDASGKRIQ